MKRGESQHLNTHVPSITTTDTAATMTPRSNVQVDPRSKRSSTGAAVAIDTTAADEGCTHDSWYHEFRHWQTEPYLVAFQRVRIMHARLPQLRRGAPPMVLLKLDHEGRAITDLVDIARAEMIHKKLPYVMKEWGVEGVRDKLDIQQTPLTVYPTPSPEPRVLRSSTVIPSS